MQAPAQAEDKYAAFRHRAFTFYFVSRFLSTFGLQIISVAVGWQIYDLTRDPFDLGLVGLIQFLPALVLILFTGAAADRYGRRTIMLVCEIIIGFFGGGSRLVCLAGPDLADADFRGSAGDRHFAGIFRARLAVAGAQPRARARTCPMPLPGIRHPGRPRPSSARWRAGLLYGLGADGALSDGPGVLRGVYHRGDHGATARAAQSRPVSELADAGRGLFLCA